MTTVDGDQGRAGIEDALSAAVRWRAAGRGVALATVIRSGGGWPCPVGRQMAVDQDGTMVGSVSGGWIQGAVVDQALRAIADGEPRLLGYGMTDDRARAAGLPGGGRIELYLQPVGPMDGKPALLARLLRLRAERRPVALVTDLVMGLQTLVFESVVHGGFGLDGPDLAAVRDCLAAGRCAVVETGEDRRLFVQVFIPALRDSGTG